MTLLLADFCKLRVSASETRKPGKPFSRAYLPEPHPVKSNASGRGAAVARCSSGTVRSVSISPPLCSGSPFLRDSPQCFHLTSALLRFAVPPGQPAVLPSHLRFAPVRCPSGTVRSASISPPLRSGSMDGVRRMGICIKICRGMRASPCIFLCRFPHCSVLCQVCIPHQPFVYFFCYFSSFFYGPDYQGLASSHVSGGEYVLNICSVAFSVCSYICPSV